MEYDSIRAGGICVKERKVLLIHRINLKHEEGNQEYYVIPGGTKEKWEELEEAVVREMKEETDLDVAIGKLYLEMEDYNPRGGKRKHFYYIVNYCGGEPLLREDSEEAKEMKEGVHFYKPMWAHLDDIDELKIVPVLVKEALQKLRDEIS